MGDIDLLLSLWNENTKKDYSTIVCFFPNEDTLYSITRKLGAQLKGVFKTHKTPFFDDGNHKCYFYCTDNYIHPPIGLGGVNTLIFYNCCDMEKFLDIYASTLPTLYSEGHTFIVLPKNTKFPLIYNNEFITIMEYD